MAKKAATTKASTTGKATAAKPSAPRKGTKVAKNKKVATTEATEAPEASQTTTPPAPAADDAQGKPATSKPPAEKPAPKVRKLSAIDAAAQVLAESKTAMTSKEMIDAMAEQKLWTSPGGKTPWATLFSAILREIATKGKESRFVKAERGKFAANG